VTNPGAAWRTALATGALALLALACVAPDPLRYRLLASDGSWPRDAGDPVARDLAARYPAYFEVILDPTRSDEPPLRGLRDDLEARPVDRHNYDALNAVAIGYFELNWRGEQARASGDMAFLSAGFRSAHLAAIPWRAYGEIDDPALRDAILDFFDDVSHGTKRGSARTRGRLADVVASLESKEADPARRARIARIGARMQASVAPLPSALEAPQP